MLPEKDLGIIMGVYDMAVRMNKLIAMGFDNDMIEWRQVNSLLNLTGVKDKRLLKRMSKNYVESYQDFKDLYELVQMVCPLIAMKKYRDNMEKHLGAIAEEESNESGYTAQSVPCDDDCHSVPVGMAVCGEQEEGSHPVEPVCVDCNIDLIGGNSSVDGNQSENSKVTDTTFVDDMSVADDLTMVDLKEIEEEFPLDSDTISKIRYAYRMDELTGEEEKSVTMEAQSVEQGAKPEGNGAYLPTEQGQLEEDKYSSTRWMDSSTRWMDAETGWDGVNHLDHILDGLNDSLENAKRETHRMIWDYKSKEYRTQEEMQSIAEQATKDSYSFLQLAEKYMLEQNGLPAGQKEFPKDTLMEKIGEAKSRLKRMLRLTKKKNLPGKEQMSMLPEGYQELCTNSLLVAMRNSMKVSCLPAMELKDHLVQFDHEHLKVLDRAYREFIMASRWNGLEFDDWIVWSTFGRQLEIALGRGR